MYPALRSAWAMKVTISVGRPMLAFNALIEPVSRNLAHAFCRRLSIVNQHPPRHTKPLSGGRSQPERMTTGQDGCLPRSLFIHEFELYRCTIQNEDIVSVPVRALTLRVCRLHDHSEALINWVHNGTGCAALMVLPCNHNLVGDVEL